MLLRLLFCCILLFCAASTPGQAQEPQSADTQAKGKAPHNPGHRHPHPQAHSHHEQTADSPRDPLPEYNAELVSQLAAQARQEQGWQRGADLFANPQSACLQCHRIGEQGGSVGPELTRLAAERTLEQIIESVLWPQRDVREEYVAWSIVLADGRVLNGYKRPASGETLHLFDPAENNLHEFSAEEIEAEARRGSLMPEGLLARLNSRERLALFGFLSRLGRDEQALNALNAAADRHRSHEPVAIDFDRAPLQPERHPYWQESINRDRVYDYYAKQANQFRGANPLPMLLTQHPSLDGGQYGHWGNQGAWVWTNDNWQQTDFGTRQAGSFRFDKKRSARTICLRLGEQGELATCFDADTLTYDGLWTGGFITVSDQRWGFLDGLLRVGEPIAGFRPTTSPDNPVRYLGYFRYGPRTIFHYRVGETEYLDAPWADEGQFVREVAPVTEHPLQHVLQGGPAQWPQVFETQAEFGETSPYAIDTFPPPFENPWKSLMFFSGIAFLPDGDALLCTMQGDVWKVSGLDTQPGSPQPVRWRRFASGLHQALGLWIDEDGIFVQCRDQLTRLHDLNNDGEADYYECYSNAFHSSPAGHDYICGLERDAEGRFYFSSSKQGLVRISADGQQADVLATGLRNPNGVGLSETGTVTAPTSEGEWVPASMIFQLTREQQAGPPPHFGAGGPRDNLSPTLPLMYLPRNLDNSSGGQVFVRGNRWGLPEDQLIHFSHGMANAFLVLRDDVNGQAQGGLCEFLPDFRAGVHRGRFRPQDGQLYVAGMRGWGCYGVDDGCLQRVRYTGNPVRLPIDFHAHTNGIVVRFTYPLTAAVAGQTASHFAQCWNYRYSRGYGSPEYSPMHPGARGHDPLAITSAHVLPDGHSLFLEIPDLQPVNQLHLSLKVDESGPAHELFLTVHALDAPFTQFPGYVPTEKVIAAHPLLMDMAISVKRVPNPFQKGSFGARQIAISTGKNLTFETSSFTVKAGELIRFTLKNPDVVPHNWALVRPGQLAHVGELANRLIADPEAFARHYIPEDDAVLFYTDVVDPGQEFSIFFNAPREPGEYPYLCTFPGHWTIMNGTIIVEAEAKQD